MSTQHVPEGSLGTSDSGTWYTVSAGQQSLWLMYQLRPALRGNCNIAFTARIEHGLDVERLASALEVLIARHPMLRTRFAVQDGVLMQHVEAQVAAPLAIVPIGSCDDVELQRRVAADAVLPFDESSAPLLRVNVYRGGSGTQVLLLTVDHMICDGWSFFELLEELGTTLTEFGAVRHERPAHDFTSFLAWQRGWLTGRQARRQLEYWTPLLKEPYPALDLPSDKFEPEARATRVLSLGSDLTARLQALSKRHGVSLFVTLLASYFIVLHRLSGQARLSIATLLPARGAEWEGIVGLFRNIAVLRAELAAGISIAALLNQLRSVVWRALKNQEYPFEELIRHVDMPGGLGAAAHFQTMFVFQKPRHAMTAMPLVTRLEGTGAVQWGGMSLRQFGDWTSAGAAGLDLMLEVMEVEDRLAVALDYNAGRFEAATIEHYLVLWRTVLQEMARDMQQRIDRLPLLSPRERHDVLTRWAVPATDYPLASCVHELFEAQVQRTPSATALVHAGRQLSYQQLNQRANRLARRLRQLGVGPDVPVALCVQRGFEMMIGMLAVLKAGGAFVPLDAAYPRERLAAMLEDSAPPVWLTDQHSRDLLPQQPEVAIIDLGDEQSWAHLPATDLPRTAGLSSQHLAYIIYTSGSTGRAKGVLVEHRMVVQSLFATQRALGIHAREKVLALTSLSFDPAILELYLPLLIGAEVVIGSREDGCDGQRISTLLERHQITLLQGTPSLWRLLLSVGWAGSAELTALCGGEAMSRQLSTQLVPRVRRLWNIYGPTETTIWSTGALIDAQHPPGQHSERVGKPFDNIFVYILDEQREPVPVGVRGEIYIGGLGVTRGYLRRPELTAERFLDDPFSTTPGAKMYRSGDLGRWHDNGEIEHLGRGDQQVKFRGYRIELGEIEAQLCAHSQVRQAAVVVREDQPGETRLVAYYVGEALEAHVLRASLEAKLPAYMVPVAYVHLAALPLSPNGKVDRKALPAPAIGAYGQQRFEEPQGYIEITLAGIWQELLQVQQIGRHDSFFELGGHSLLATKLVARLRQALNIELPLQQVFTSPKLLDLAEAAGLAAADSLPPVVPVERTRRLPVSHAQEQLWLLAQLEGASAAYHIGGSLRLCGHLDKRALRAAFDTIVSRHEALRTTFVLRDGQLEQQIAGPGAGFQLSELDLAGTRQDVAELSRRELAQPFDLEHGPLLRGRLVCCSAGEHVLLITLHHIVCDGWSLSVLVQELTLLYSAHVRGESASLAPLPVQFADYAVWQRQHLRGPLGQQLREYWRHTLAGAPALLELPSDRVRPARQDFAGATLPVRLSAELPCQLRQLSARHGVTLYMTLLAGWAATLSRLSGQSEVVVGCPVANRPKLELEGLIGMFVSSLALRVGLAGEPTVQELLQRVKATFLQAQAHQDLPFEQVVEVVQPPRALAYSPLFQVMFVWQNTAALQVGLPGLSSSLLETARHTAQFDLTLALAEAGDAISGTLEYATSLFDASTVERYLGCWLHLLQAMVVDDVTPVQRMPLLNAMQRQQLLVQTNDTAQEYPSACCLHELFEAQVQRTPTAVAAEFAGEQLTYQELEQRANRLAHHLQALGVVADAPVALCVCRSLDMVVSMLAVLKAGGAYVPLDPAYPRERLALMLHDSEPVVLLTDQASRSVLPQVAGLNVVDVHAVEQWAHLPDSNPPRMAGAQQLAYVIYTSGSSGTPKGVMVEHRGVVSFLCWMQHTYRLHARDRVLALTSLSFDIAATEIYLPLLCGARLIIGSREDASDGARIAALLQQHGITLTQGTPSMWRLLLAAQWSGSPQLTAICGGEALSRQLSLQIAARTKALWNLYGPTETTIWSTAAQVGLPDDNGEASERIGRPIANTSIYILDERGEPVPLGVQGEIYIGGIGVARGYLKRPELTAARFLRDPFSNAPGARMYRTGDLGRWRNELDIEYRGRNDHQVKLRGFRIELGEIEAQLRWLSGVREAAVVVRQSPQAEPRLVAYYVRETGSMVSPQQLKEQLSERLPDYMVPMALVELEQLPLTSNGKLDRNALPEPQREMMSRHQYQAPQGELEEALAEIWRELLQLPRVGREDDFFELGGNSLLAMHFIARVRDELHIELPLADMFLYPRLLQVAERLVEHLVQGSDPAELARLIDEIDLDCAVHVPVRVAHVMLSSGA